MSFPIYWFRNFRNSFQRVLFSNGNKTKDLQKLLLIKVFLKFLFVARSVNLFRTLASDTILTLHYTVTHNNLNLTNRLYKRKFAFLRVSKLKSVGRT